MIGTTTMVGGYGGAYGGSYAAPYATQAYTIAAPTYAMPTTTAVPAVMPAGPPASLTAGIPTPDQILTQKKQFSDALDKQLKDAIDTIKKETEIEKQMVKFNADKQIAMYNLQVDEKLVEAQALAEEQATISELELK